MVRVRVNASEGELVRQRRAKLPRLNPEKCRETLLGASACAMLGKICWIEGNL